MNEEQRRQFGGFLRALRLRRGLTQRSAGELAKVSSPYLTQLERGQRNPPSREVLARLADVYGVSEESMLVEAGYRPGGITTASPDRIDWAFEIVCGDPNFSVGHRVRDIDLTVEVKALMVEIYQEATGRKLLTDDETRDARTILEAPGSAQ